MYKIQDDQVLDLLLKESLGFISANSTYISGVLGLRDLMGDYGIYVGRMICDGNSYQVKKSFFVIEELLVSGSEYVKDAVFFYFLEFLCSFLKEHHVKTNLMYQWMGPRLRSDMDELEMMMPHLISD